MATLHARLIDTWTEATSFPQCIRGFVPPHNPVPASASTSASVSASVSAVQVAGLRLIYLRDLASLYHVTSSVMFLKTCSALGDIDNGNTHTPASRHNIEMNFVRAEREYSRNESSKLICNHEACLGKNKSFKRPYELKRHMDKHERPYKCEEPSCRRILGFTYKGGLLRHMREVHKKGVSPARRPLYCPHANCVRSTGEIFTRRENLKEHLRRRHSCAEDFSHCNVTQFQLSTQKVQDPQRESWRTDPQPLDERVLNCDLEDTKVSDQLTVAERDKSLAMPPDLPMKQDYNASPGRKLNDMGEKQQRATIYQNTEPQKAP